MAVGSIGGVSAYSAYSAIRPLEYSIDNQTQTSDAYSDSLRTTDEAAVDAVSPVFYPDAQEVPSISTAAELDTDAITQASMAYNKIAEGFAGTVTSYTAGGESAGYQTVGSGLDIYI